ncbi:MAG: tripartite tricarboxylate transporter substrate-binding protein, partial [Achromobacter pestifer]
MHHTAAAIALALGLTATAPTIAAPTFPDHPIRMVVPFPPGSITDVVARSLGKHMAADLGQPVVVENKPGANGIIGTHDVA